MNHRSLRLTAAMAAVALGLTACGGSGSSAGSSAAGSASGSSATGSSAAAAGQEYTVGINQLTTHPALDAAREGFKEAFTEAGLTVTFDEQNAQGDQATVTSIASTFSSGDADLVAAIATPAAQGTASAVKDKPVVFMAVTDPRAAELVAADDAPGGNVTGVSDRNPVKEQLQLLKDVKADAKTVGIVYNSGEVNSKVQVDQAKAAGAELGLEVKEATITNSSEVQQGVQALGDVDGIYVPTDNAVVSALETVLSYGKEKKVPVISADTDSVEKGALGTFGIDYKEHGKQAGEMAVKILRDGAKPESTPVGYADPASLELVLNKQAAASFGVELPQEMLEKADEVIGG